MKEYKGYKILLNSGNKYGLLEKNKRYYFVNPDGYMVSSDSYVFAKHCSMYEEVKEDFNSLALKKMVDIIENKDKLLKDFDKDNRRRNLKDKLNTRNK